MKKSADILSSWIRSIVGAFLVLSICLIAIFITQILHLDRGSKDQTALATVPGIVLPMPDIVDTFTENIAATSTTVLPATLTLKGTETIDYPFAKIIRIIDGDTVVISTNNIPPEILQAHNLDPHKMTVRLIGINTPETVDPRRPVQCYGKEASKEAARLLQDQIVRVETDNSQDVVDKYNRLLAYIFIVPEHHSQNQNVGENNQIDDNKNELFYNSYMIRQGYAYEYTYAHPYRYQKQFKEEERFARDNKNGLWQPGICN